MSCESQFKRSFPFLLVKHDTFWDVCCYHFINQDLLSLGFPLSSFYPESLHLSSWPAQWARSPGASLTSLNWLAISSVMTTPRCSGLVVCVPSQLDWLLAHWGQWLAFNLQPWAPSTGPGSERAQGRQDWATSVTSWLMAPLLPPGLPGVGTPTQLSLSSHTGTCWASGGSRERGWAWFSCQSRGWGQRIWGWECDSRVAPVGWASFNAPSVLRGWLTADWVPWI